MGQYRYHLPVLALQEQVLVSGHLAVEGAHPEALLVRQRCPIPPQEAEVAAIDRQRLQGRAGPEDHLQGGDVGLLDLPVRAAQDEDPGWQMIQDDAQLIPLLCRTAVGVICLIPGPPNAASASMRAVMSST